MHPSKTIRGRRGTRNRRPNLRPVYEYVCGTCGVVTHSNVRDDWIVCVNCPNRAQRRWGFSVLPSMQPAFNATTGTVVRNRADLTSQLSEASERASSPRVVYDGYGEAHQITPPEHRYVPVDLRDREACGATSEGLDATYDALRRQGNDPAADRLRKVME